jgi:transcription elongation factor Elf1
MPYDRRDSGEISDQEEDDDKKSGKAQGGKRRFDEFDCPACSANNPVGDGFGNNEEVTCNYCGLEFRVQIDDEGKLKLREL